jgi:hypothetical protein
VPFSADRRSFVDGFEQVDAAKRQRLSTVNRTARCWFLTGSNTATRRKSTLGTRASGFINFPRLAESPSGAALFGRENVLDLQTRA